MNSLQRLHAGQDAGPWIDFIDRNLINSGALAAFVSKITDDSQATIIPEAGLWSSGSSYKPMVRGDPDPWRIGRAFVKILDTRVACESARCDRRRAKQQRNRAGEGRSPPDEPLRHGLSLLT